jgi:hypothetical protein
MSKKPYSSLFYLLPRSLAWGISWPHISTPENLHAKQTHDFSNYVRAFPVFFWVRMKLCLFLKKNFRTNFFTQYALLQIAFVLGRDNFPVLKLSVIKNFSPVLEVSLSLGC